MLDTVLENIAAFSSEVTQINGGQKEAFMTPLATNLEDDQCSYFSEI